MVDIKKILKNNFIHKPKDFLKVLLGYLVIILFATFPLIIAIEGAKLEHFITGNQVNESNSAIVTFGWLGMITLPFGFAFFIIWTITCVKYSISFFSKKKHE
jgi:hypothetical protein